MQRGDAVDYNGHPAGYADQPDEVITYVDAHDNETLFDALTYKLPAATPMADRVRMNTVSLATTALAQTPSFWHAGADLLRSKSLDRNSLQLRRLVQHARLDRRGQRLRPRSAAEGGQRGQVAVPCSRCWPTRRSSRRRATWRRRRPRLRTC